MITQSQILYISGASLAGLAALAYLNRPPSPPATTALPVRFTDEDLTERFVSAIPGITRELNLELATATFNETFLKSSNLTTCWGLLNLGTSVVQIQTPVTYRYHLCLRDQWQLELKQGRLVVRAPVIKPSLPPAIHTDALTTMALRGWCRGSTDDLMAELQRSITPTLNAYAGDELHLGIVRPQCRASVAEFVKLWLEREHQSSQITSIQVVFNDETQHLLNKTSQP